MPISVGGRIGPYEILEPLGAGGMGEVYRARDAKLNRDVAIKVLPELFSTDPERLARFRREAQVLASLNHQNIGHIYGLEDQSGVHALVLELVEGATLADRIAQGPIPLDEAVPIATQIADALECAHELGIIHRDLKPANIKLRPDGTVKVLDFGLAKALDPMVSSGSDAMNSPTLTARGTQLGVIVGTAAYMAPEQARGKAVDRRADIWAFGGVLYEMLSGKRAFEGDDVSITLAAVLKDDVDWTALPADLPASVVWVLRRCLEKDPKRRLSAIGDARLELDAPLHIAEPRDEVPTRRPLLAWMVATVAVITAATLLALWAPWRATRTAAPMAFSADTGTPNPLYADIGGSIAMSPDGRMLAFVALEKGTRYLFVRTLDQLHATRLPGTEDADGPFFSRDGKSLAFFTSTHLKRIAVTGGTAIPLARVTANGSRGGSWGEDGTIVFQASTAPFAKLMRVSDEGGDTPVPMIAEGVNDGAQRWPQVLPGGRAVIYSTNVTPTGWDSASVVVQPLPQGEPRTLIEGGFHARYVASGHLLYVQGSTLFAVPFDLNRLERRGRPVPLINDVSTNAVTGGAHYAVSNDGVLAYLSGAGVTLESAITLVDQSGKVSTLPQPPIEWVTPRFSPTGDRVALVITKEGVTDIYVYDIARQRLDKITHEAGSKSFPVWTPSGERIVYTLVAPGIPGNLYVRRADGTGTVERLTSSPYAHTAYSFDPAGKYLAMTERDPKGSPDILILPFEGTEGSGWKAGTPRPFLKTSAAETHAMFSPDGRWIAYMSTETGRAGIYVRPFAGDGGPWPITSGGIFPTWSHARDELLFVMIDTPTTLMAANYSVVGNAFRPGNARPWAPITFRTQRPGRTIDLHPNGRQVVAPLTQVHPTQNPRMVFVINFFEQLRQLKSTGGSQP